MTTQPPADYKALTRRIKELNQQQAQADALFSSIGQGAIATDKEGRINQINQAALDMLGVKRKDMLGKWFPEVMVAQGADGQVVPPMDRPITKAFLTGKAVTEQTLYRHKNKTLIPVTVTVSPILLNKQPVGAVEVFRDITHEVEVDLMKTEFIYLASHQLRTPLTAVKVYTHMLKDGYQGALTPKQQKLTKIILSSLDRMNEVISTLLNISRIDAGKLTLVTSSVSLADLINQTLKELRPTIHSKHITIQTTLQSHEPIITDAALAKEVCVNLLSNAVKYTPERGTITISLDTSKSSQTIRIEDTGYGIPETSAQSLFSKFYRAPNVLSKNEEGTGLGLYLVKGIADVMGGKVWFESEEDVGSTFFFQLPLAPPASNNTMQTEKV